MTNDSLYLIRHEKKGRSAYDFVRMRNVAMRVFLRGFSTVFIIVMVLVLVLASVLMRMCDFILCNGTNCDRSVQINEPNKVEEKQKKESSFAHEPILPKLSQ